MSAELDRAGQGENVVADGIVAGDMEERNFADLSLVLFEQALLSEGAALEDPAGFVRRVNNLLLEK